MDLSRRIWFWGPAGPLSAGPKSSFWAGQLKKGACRGCWSWRPEPWWRGWWRFRTCPPWWEHKAPALYPSLVMNGVNLGYNDNGDHRRCAWTNPTSGGRNQNQDTRPHGLLCLTAESRLRCCCVSQFQIYDISWKQICILFEFAFSDLLNIVSKFVHQASSLALFQCLVPKLATRFCHLHCHIALECPLASSASIALVSSSARVKSVKFHKRLGRTDIRTQRSNPRFTWVR